MFGTDNSMEYHAGFIGLYYIYIYFDKILFRWIGYDSMCFENCSIVM